ncbi:MAG: hypothetical protein OEV40_21430, partial [Acidimicrobiia bacterium]|nr:hypothetical protein [Acidimicrobiia bacterium]
RQLRETRAALSRLEDGDDEEPADEPGGGERAALHAPDHSVEPQRGRLRAIFLVTLAALAVALGAGAVGYAVAQGGNETTAEVGSEAIDDTDPSGSAPTDGQDPGSGADDDRGER